jgi:hypothetical protein
MASPARAGFCDATQSLPVASIDAVDQWKRWSKDLTTTVNYLKNNVTDVTNTGNPYRDVVLRVTYTNCTTGATLSTYGFWDKEKTFKIRGAFPPPPANQPNTTTEDWQWQTTCGRRPGGIGPDCLGDTALHNKFGRIRVSRAAGNYLYTNGFLKVDASGRFLVHDNAAKTKFFWLGDTAWTLPVLAGSAARTDVLDYFAKRGAVDGNLPSFTVVQMAPAPQWGLSNPAPTLVFDAAAGCTPSGPLPNNCSRWVSDYWTNFDQLVEAANQNGLVVAIIGVMEPLNQGTYPAIEDAEIFARNLVARTYANFVVYSPGFDSFVTGHDALIKAVGNKIREATARHLIVNHNAGQSPVSEIESLHGETWLNFQLFQSGKSPDKIPGSGIPTSIPNSDKAAIQLYNMMDRAISIPTTLAKKTPAKPSANGETAYDRSILANTSLQPNFTPARIRQTAYLSLLSGAFGYTYGDCWFSAWGLFSPGGCPTSTEASGLGIPGSRQTRILRASFQTFNWEQLKPEPARIQKPGRGRPSGVEDGGRPRPDDQCARDRGLSAPRSAADRYRLQRANRYGRLSGGARPGRRDLLSQQLDRDLAEPAHGPSEGGSERRHRQARQREIPLQEAELRRRLRCQRQSAAHRANRHDGFVPARSEFPGLVSAERGRRRDPGHGRPGRP